VSYWVDNDLMIRSDDGRSFPILGLTDGKTLNTRIMMAIAGAKVAHHATGQEKFKAVYDQLIDQFGVRGLKTFRTEKDFDDAEHVFCHLDNLFRIEKDPELLAAYRVVADGLWANHKGDAQSLFTYIYCALAPDAPGKEQALQEALFSLQTWPTDMTIQPRMNSLDKDAKPPYPVYAAAWDNEYIWKGNLLRADGWLSRAVTDVAVPAEDGQVLYAVGEPGDVYQSRDGGTTWAGWQPVNGDLTSPVRAIDAGDLVRILFAACEDGFYATTTGGYTWERMPVPEDGGQPHDVLVDPTNANVIYAVTDKGVYRSVDYGEKFLGKRWESLTATLPEADTATFTMAPAMTEAEPGHIYAILDGVLFTRRLDEAEWHQGGRLGFPEQTRGYEWLVAAPEQPGHAVYGLYTQYGGMGTMSMLQQTNDGGMTWTPSLEDIYERYSQGGMMGLMPLFIKGRITQPALAPTAAGAMFLGSERGVLKSTDGGTTWETKREGLDIPVVNAVMAPRNTDWVFASTPAGLFVSKDGGETWENAHLCLQFDKNTRRELGGAAFIDAYWRARYHGFIDADAANAPWQE